MSRIDVDIDIDRKCLDIMQALNPHQLKLTLKSAYRKEAKKVRQIAQASLAATGMHNAAKMASGVLYYVYSRGGGFAVTVKYGRRAKKAIYTNSRGQTKPVQMWADEGTEQRYTKRRGWKAGHYTGSMPAYHFMQDAEQKSGFVEADLWKEIEAAVDRRAQKLGLK